MPDPFVQDKLRSLVECRAIGINERVQKFFKWHRDMRAQMIAEQYPGIEDENMTVKWILRGIKAHP